MGFFVYLKNMATIRELRELLGRPIRWELPLRLLRIIWKNIILFYHRIMRLLLAFFIITVLLLPSTAFGNLGINMTNNLTISQYSFFIIN